MAIGILEKTGRKVCFGCKPTPRRKLAMAHYVGRHIRALPPPPLNINNVAKVSAWDIYFNDQDGDCVTAEEGNAKRVISTATGAPELDIPDKNLYAFASRNGFINGANLDEVMDAMATQGMVGADGVAHKDGPHGTLDWTNQTEVQLALQYFKTIKIGVGSKQLMQASTDESGWFLTNAREDSNVDHCVGIYGCGTAEFCAKAFGVSLPDGLAPDTFCVMLYTWATVGILTWKSFQAITGEAWVRTTDPDRADAKAWDEVAASDYKDIAHQEPSPVHDDPAPDPTPPQPAPTRRAASLLLRGEALLSANPSIRERLAKLLTMGEAEMAAIEKELGL